MLGPVKDGLEYPLNLPGPTREQLLFVDRRAVEKTADLKP